MRAQARLNEPIRSGMADEAWSAVEHADHRLTRTALIMAHAGRATCATTVGAGATARRATAAPLGPAHPVRTTRACRSYRDLYLRRGRGGGAGPKSRCQIVPLSN